MWRAIKDVAIFDEDEDDKDDNSEDDSISEIRRDAAWWENQEIRSSQEDEQPQHSY